MIRAAGIVGVLVMLLADGRSAADSLIPSLGAFDAARVEGVGQWVDVPDDAEALGEAARLLYRLRRVDQQTLTQRTAADARWQPGDAVVLQGIASEIAASPLPADLAEVLEMPRVYRLTMDVDGLDRIVITETVPRIWLSDPQGVWQAAVAGMVIRSDSEGQATVIAASRAQWYPSDPAGVPRSGWALLGRHGFDVGLIDQLIVADRQPLGKDEHDAFYAMLAAAQDAAAADAPPAQKVTVAQLLSDSQQWIGQWIRIDLETARLTRIAVDDAVGGQILGGDRDHYWQIDAFADLGDVAVRLEPTEPGDSAVTFDNRYPVSLAAIDLPAELQQAIVDQAGRGAVVAMVRRPVTVEGFFYRLWSYPSGYARSQGGGQPFGPLLMASRIRALPVPTATGSGVAAIGPVAAAVFLLALAVLVIWLWRIARRDARITAARRRREAADLPGGGGL